MLIQFGLVTVSWLDPFHRPVIILRFQRIGIIANSLETKTAALELLSPYFDGIHVMFKNRSACLGHCET